MARNKDYIPDADDAFYYFQQNLLGLLQQHVIQWNLPETKLNLLLQEQAKYDEAYRQNKNPSTRTSAITKTHRLLRTSFEKSLRSFVAEHVYNNSSLTTEHRLKAGLGLRKTVRQKRPAIQEAPAVHLQAIAGSRIKFTCRSSISGRRTAMHPHAGELEVRYSISTEAPSSPVQCTDTFTSSRSKFTIAFSQQLAGQKMWCFVRWRHATINERSGPWTGVMGLMVGE